MVCVSLGAYGGCCGKNSSLQVVFFHTHSRLKFSAHLPRFVSRTGSLSGRGSGGTQGFWLSARSQSHLSCLWCQEGRQMLINSYLKFYLYWLHYGEIQFCRPPLLPQLPSGKGQRCCRHEICMAGDSTVTKHREEGN